MFYSDDSSGHGHGFGSCSRSHGGGGGSSSGRQQRTLCPVHFSQATTTVSGGFKRMAGHPRFAGHVIDHSRIETVWIF
jgi:hypothetical protein